ncbi:MauE/DoxX family redox-associated membrane protein [Pedobacter hartonius]|uniref:Methylamine utilisation protein MauE domain-containing protein n=1 Tax=Pedobacter hartonius TaxID=425514 RepID=A0A1H4CXY6_9SPHI|nr:MauE/DoxX family redox-associated membrane protein [Pedobacter hartonius]SEA65274.1 hypothetical protein SAMN05443550_104244 [Pedobacter hartonius]
METIIRNYSIFHITTKHKEQVFNIVTILCSILFLYAGTIKVWNHEKFERFQNVLKIFPLTGSFAGTLSYAIPGAEFLIGLLLLPKATKKAGLQLFSATLIIFTLYIIYMVIRGGDLPCVCGGLLEILSWRQHIGFNILLITAAIVALTSKNIRIRAAKFGDEDRVFG